MTSPAFDQHITPSDARKAASLLLLRDAANGAGIEVLMLRRTERAGDLYSGAAVFPGGVLDARDRDAHAFCVGATDAEMSARLRLPEGGLDYAVAALRETFEEVGLLLVQGDVDVDVEALKPWRDRLHKGQASAAEFAAATGLRWDAGCLAYYSHWLTPLRTPRRFDTRFFAALAPAGQVAQADLTEAQALMWLAPRDALDPQRALKLLPVTQRTLHALAKFESAAQALVSIRARREIAMVMPRRVHFSKAGKQVAGVVLPDEFAYAEVAQLDPDGHGDVAGDIVAGRAVRLSPRVVRVTAPNAGPMTGPGTNTYLVNDVDSAEHSADCTAIDPGPISADHLQALLQAAQAGGRRITRILVTHTHGDHSPGAVALAAATGAPVLGMHALHPEWQDKNFAPTRELAHGERIAVGPSSTLRVVHTPGHASNHLCFLLEEEQTLFTGDHVMQGSTVVINPPDGDMAVYLRALHALLDEPLQWLAPGHGFLVAQPHAVLRALIAHRGRREAKVVAALQRDVPAPLASLVLQVYDDVPAGLHAMATRSLWAHLLKLQGDGVARESAQGWQRV
jgi:glyoxylase-like metal-dependent hydrolase (beta-lactamase superfamily II)/8-oxo-dGTP pyrophosphatase MutT (NUDIX family)